jgi:hypothetical protein
MATKFDKSQRESYIIQSESFNRGWALDLNRGHKIRISMADYIEQMEYQATHGEAVSTTKFMEDNPEYQAEVEKEEEEQEAHWEDEQAAEEPATEAPAEAGQERPSILTEEMLDALLPIPATHRLKRDLMTRGDSKLTTIHCVDCGAERKIKVQDQFQTTRCESCQKKFRAAKRRLATKAAKAQKNPAE